ncbi:hypothetical protein [Streptomyces sp. DvalAA-19]|uniref:hypothetical protein n=1 Tax=Streptomyces sp. DvalAA-19 TaxID=1839761 RepID=UPI00114CCA11|nr:hypothetical protein [Streptomyces sp. DvalAA-19]
MIKIDEQRTAVSYALGVKGSGVPAVGVRRQMAMKAMTTSTTTLRRLEEAGFGELAHVIVGYSAMTKRQVDGDAPVVSDTQRIEDLERVVATLKRLIYSMVESAGPAANLLKTMKSDTYAYQLSLIKVMHRVYPNSLHPDLFGLANKEENYALMRLANEEPLDVDWPGEGARDAGPESLALLDVAESIGENESPENPKQS